MYVAKAFDIQQSVIDTLTTVKSSLANTSPRSLADRLDDIADVRDWGVVNDPNGASVAANTTALLNAIAASAGKTKLLLPASITVVVSPLVTTASNINFIIDGTIKLVAGAAASKTSRANLLELGGSNIVISGTGTLDGNASNQSWAAGQVVGGITANTFSTSGVQVVDPGSAATALSNITISGIGIKNVGNWPICLAYVSDVIIDRVRMKDSGNSPQFFASADRCTVTNSTSSNITDAGWSCYAGNRNVSIINHTVVGCNQGLGSYCETSSRTPNENILIALCRITQCKNGAIGFTTGGSNPTPTQKHCTAYGNKVWGNNTAGKANTASLSAVGCMDVKYINNEVYNEGSSTSYMSYGLYVDQTSTGVTITGNTFDSIGSTSIGGTAINLYNPTNLVMTNNIIRNTNTVTSVGITGSVGLGAVIENNTPVGSFSSKFWNLTSAADTKIVNQDQGGSQRMFTQGVSITKGYIAGSAAVVSAAGTTQATATVLTTQYTQVTAGTGGVLLPQCGAGCPITVVNTTGSDINVYPNTGETINGQNVGLPITLSTNTLMVFTQAKQYQWYQTVGGTSSSGGGSNTNTGNTKTITVSDGVSANGTTLSDATALTTTLTYVTSTTNSGAMKLPAPVIGQSYTIGNRSGSDILIFPDASTTQIESNGAGNSQTIETNSTVTFVCTTATQWRVENM